MASALMEERKAGRPEKPIDWEVVDEALKGGCTGVEIAAWFNIHPHNFYDRVFKKYGMIFTDYAATVAPAGAMNLRMVQYKQALKGNTQLLIMLGEERLGQGVKRDVDVNSEVLIQFEEFTNMLEARQAKSDLTISETNNNAESKS
jgi:hypothetical protein